MAGRQMPVVVRRVKTRAVSYATLPIALILSVTLSLVVVARETEYFQEQQSAVALIAEAECCASGASSGSELIFLPARARNNKKHPAVKKICAVILSPFLVVNFCPPRRLDKPPLRKDTGKKISAQKPIRAPPSPRPPRETDFSDTRFFPSRPPETGILAAARATIQHIYTTEIRSNGTPEFVVSAHNGAIIEGVV